MSFTQSPLVFYNDNSNNPGIFIEWERNFTSTTYFIIYRSAQFDGTYTQIASVAFPTNELVDASGTPASYYKVEEYNSSDVLLGSTQPFSGDELLIKSSLRYELQHLCNIPIFDEEVIFRGTRTKGSLAFPYWNSSPKPEIRITGKSDEGDRDPLIELSDVTSIYKTINAAYDPIQYSRDGITTNYTNANNYPDGLKYKLDYKGGIYFVNDSNQAVAIQSYDTVYASYSVKLLTSEQMNTALYMALQTINAQPGAAKYSSFVGLPFYYEPALVYGAVYYLLRSLLVSLSARQRRLLLEDPDARIIEDLKSTTQMYKEDFEKLVEKLPIARFPGIRSVVVPEFNMPGGRSRFFRYIWGLGTGS
jgi:hypothetical protein